MAGKLNIIDLWKVIKDRAHRVLVEAESVIKANIKSSQVIETVIYDCQVHRQSVRDYEDDNSVALKAEVEASEFTSWEEGKKELEDTLSGAIQELRIRQQQNEDNAKLIPPVVHNTNQVSSKVRLPKLQIPEFSGLVSEWDNWYATYKVHIHNDTGLAGTTKYAYLIQYVKGIALQIVKNYQGTDAGYDAAISALLAHYDDPNRQTDCVIDKLYDLKAPAVNNNEQLQRYTLKIQGIMNDMYTVGISVNEVEPLVRRWIVRNTPDAIMQRVYIGQGLYPSLKKIIKGFDTIIRSSGDTSEPRNSNNQTWRPRFSSTSSPQPRFSVPQQNRFRFSSQRFNNPRQGSPHPSSPQQRSNYPGNRDNNRSTHAIQITDTHQEAFRPCVFCGQKHSSSGCLNVSNVNERVQIMKQKNMCIRCGKAYHDRAPCLVKYPCLKCGDDHHSWLCRTVNTSDRTMASVTGEL